MKTCCIFAGARGDVRFQPDAALIAGELVSRGHQIIYGGSSKGVMGAVCKAVKDYGGVITGVLPEKIYSLNHFDPDIEMLVGVDMAARKKHFWDRSDSFLCLPGGPGTMDELWEVWTLMKLGYMPPKPTVVFNCKGFYDPLQSLVDVMVHNGFMSKERADLVQFVTEPMAAVNLVTA